jgi:broad specificity phosphatase PhoE
MIDLIHPIYVLRHGETEWNFDERMQGHQDSPLTPRGRAQAAQQGEVLRALGLPVGTEFRSSPQGRSRITAEIACSQFGQITDDPDLMELGLGRWEGHRVPQMEAEAPELFKTKGLFWKFFAPGGESYEAIEQRCQNVLDRVTAPTVLITHGVTSRILRVLALGRAKSDYASLPGGQGVVYEIRDREQTRWSVSDTGEILAEKTR